MNGAATEAAIASRRKIGDQHKFVKNVPRFYVHQLEQISKPNFVAGVKDYLAKTEGLFDDVSRVRMP
jgi:hypothetical protein